MKKTFKEKLSQFVNCTVLDNHHWTCDAKEKIPPPDLATDFNFWRYARMYCKRCGKISKFSIDMMVKSRKEDCHEAK